MFCTNCGTKFEGNFCPNCGTPAYRKPDKSDKEIPATAHAANATAAASPAPEEKHRAELISEEKLPDVPLGTYNINKGTAVVGRDSITIEKDFMRYGETYHSHCEVFYWDLATVYLQESASHYFTLCLRTTRTANIPFSGNMTEEDIFSIDLSPKEEETALRLYNFLKAIAIRNSHPLPELVEVTKRFSLRCLWDYAQVERISRTKEEIIRENRANGIACCPKCGSTSLSANKKGFSAGKAAVGAFVVGAYGLAAGAIGSGKVKVTCLNCGYSWKL